MSSIALKLLKPLGLPEKLNLAQLIKSLVVPMSGILVFLFIWNIGAQNIQTSLGEFPGPAQVYEESKNLIAEHNRERQKEVAFYDRLEIRNAKKLEANPDAVIKTRPYTGKPTFIDQIGTSLITVLAGFFAASLIAIPAGIVIGLNKTLYSAFNPVIQLFKPVSPLAWLPLVTMVVSAVYVSDDPMFAKSFVTSLITVSLCCLWPTLLNTAVGVSTISADLNNVSKVLRLP